MIMIMVMMNRNTTLLSYLLVGESGIVYDYYHYYYYLISTSYSYNTRPEINDGFFRVSCAAVIISCLCDEQLQHQETH